MNRRSIPSARRAAAAVELAVVLPLLVLLTLAAIDFGRIVQAYVIVSHAARAGAGYASTHCFTSYTRASWETQIRLAVQRELEGLSGFDAGKLQVNIQSTTETSDRTRVSVEVTYPYSTVVTWAGLPTDVQLYRSLIVRQYR
jgi:Flp pilus assembly protein TadG